MSQPASDHQPLQFGLFDWIEQDKRPAAEIFEQRLQMLEYADRNGFYSYHLAEHHITPLSLAPSPGVFLSAAFQRTKNIRLGPLVYLLPFYSPLRLLQEVCMLDQLSQGRLDLGIGRGIVPMEAERYNVDMAEGWEMFQEALEILLMGFTKGSISYEGKHYQYQDTRLWLHPYQKPYPPLWYASNNTATVPWMASHGLNTCTVFSTAADVKPHVELYKQTWEQHKEDAGRLNHHVPAPKIGLARHLYLAPTDKEAVSEARAAFNAWFSNINHLWAEVGDTHLEPMRNFDELHTGGIVLAGSPASVRRQLQETVAETGINYFCPIFAFGDLDHRQTMRSMELFVSEIMPHI